MRTSRPPKSTCTRPSRPAWASKARWIEGRKSQCPISNVQGESGGGTANGREWIQIRRQQPGNILSPRTRRARRSFGYGRCFLANLACLARDNVWPGISPGGVTRQHDLFSPTVALGPCERTPDYQPGGLGQAALPSEPWRAWRAGRGIMPGSGFRRGGHPAYSCGRISGNGSCLSQRARRTPRQGNRKPVSRQGRQVHKGWKRTI